MATRKIKDAQDTTTNELIYFKGHAKATYMSDGRNVEEAINQIGTGEGGGTSSDGRKEVIYCESLDGYNIVIDSMKPNVVYWCAGVENLTIESFEDPIMGMDTYDIFTAIIQLGESSDTISLTLPDNVRWANGVIPEITPDYHELSISRIADGDYSDYFAVLTSFKSVE